MKTIIAFIIASIVLFLSGCTDAQMASYGALGEPGKIVCYSGGQIVFEDESTGKITSVDQGDGVQFKSKKSGKYVRAYADCIITSL